MNNEHLRDLDNTIVDFLIRVLSEFDKEEDNYMSPQDREKIYELLDLLEEYRNGYNKSYNETKGNLEKWEAAKKKEYDRMFKLLKELLPKLII